MDKESEMKKLYIISVFILSSLLTGCYTQMATRDYEREDFGTDEGEGYLSEVEFYDTLFAGADTASYDTVWVDEDGQIYENLYADYPVSKSVYYPEIIYVGGGYYRPYWDYWYYPGFSYYSWNCLYPAYWPSYYPGYYCGFNYYNSYYDPYYYGGGYGYAVSDPKYKYRSNTSHDSRLRDNDGERASTRTRDGFAGGGGYVGRTASINNSGGTSVGKSRSMDIDKEIGKSRGSTEVGRTSKNDRLKVSFLSDPVKTATRNAGTKDSEKVFQSKNPEKKITIENKSYEGSRKKIYIKSKSGDTSRNSSGTKIYAPKKNTSNSKNSSGRVYKESSKSSNRGTSGKSYSSKRKSSSSESYSAPKSSGRSSNSKSYSSPSRGSSSRSSYSPSSGSSSRSSGSRSSGSSSGGSSNSGRSSGKSRR
jgi:hypothetical protein